MRALGCVAALALALGACTERLPDAPVGAGAIRLQLRAAVAGNSSDAFAKTDAAHVHLTQGDAVLMDSTLSFSAGGNAEIPLAVRLPSPTGTVVLLLQLLGRGQVLFQGSGEAALQRGVSTTLDVTLTPVVTLSAPDSVTLTALGDSARLGGAVVFASGDTLTGSQVTWSGNGGPVASIGADGLVVALSEGVTQASASYLSFSRTTRIRVQAAVTRVTIAPDTFALVTGGTQALTAVAQDRRGHPLARTFTWQSSDASVATVDSTGVVTGVAAGTATITATTQGQSASAQVTVRRVPVAAVQVTPPSATLLVGGTVQLTATTLDASGAVLTGRAVAWSSSDATVATVSATGLVTAVGLGPATITATSEGVTGSSSITVGQPLLAVSPGRLSFQAVAAAGAPPAQSLSISNAGLGSLTGLSAGASYPAGGPSGWITLSLSSSTAPANVTVGVNPSSLKPGATYSGTVNIGSANAGGASIPVSFTLTQPLLAVSTTGARIQYVDTATTVLQVSNAGTGTLTGLSVSVSYPACAPGAYCAPAGWLTASLGSGSAPTTLNLRLTYPGQFDPPGSAIVTITSTVPGAGSQQVTVTMY